MEGNIRLKTVVDDSEVKKLDSTISKVASSASSSFGSAFKFGALANIGSKAMDGIISGGKEVLSIMSENSAATKTFAGVMQSLGASDVTKQAQKSMQAYAQQTVYSTSDMLNAYGQLEAAGVKSIDKVVKGFGGFAGATEDPKNAMKSLLYVAGQISPEAKLMAQDWNQVRNAVGGMSGPIKKFIMQKKGIDDWNKAMAEGTIKGQDFFDAIEELGNTKSMQKLATQPKTVGQAMDSLKETLATKLSPAFEKLSGVAIKVISSITDWISKIDVSGLVGVFDSIGNSINSIGLGNLVTIGGSLLGLVATGLLIYKTFNLFKSIGGVMNPLNTGLSSFAKNMLAVGFAIGALTALTFAIGQLAQLPMANVIVAGVVIGALAIAVAIAGQMANAAVGGLMALSFAFLAIGAAALLVGAGIALASFGFTMLASAVLLLGANIGTALAGAAGLIAIGAAALATGAMLLGAMAIIMVAAVMFVASSAVFLAGAVVFAAAMFLVDAGKVKTLASGLKTAAESIMIMGANAGMAGGLLNTLGAAVNKAGDQAQQTVPQFKNAGQAAMNSGTQAASGAGGWFSIASAAMAAALTVQRAAALIENAAARAAAAKNRMSFSSYMAFMPAEQMAFSAQSITTTATPYQPRMISNSTDNNSYSAPQSVNGEVNLNAELKFDTHSKKFIAKEIAPFLPTAMNETNRRR